LQAASLRLGKTAVLAPDDGVISARSATVGSLTQPGQELFRLIRGGRLEWRAEVPSADLARVQPGMPATLTSPAGQPVTGKVRAVAPSVDPQTRNGLVYVDLPPSAVRAGMFARGEFELGRSPAVTLPPAVVLREGLPTCSAWKARIAWCRPRSRWAAATASGSRCCPACRPGRGWSNRVPASWPMATP
jgi:multidrug efflux pump subunit AcrA (membrane-fusion protein)